MIQDQIPIDLSDPDSFWAKQFARAHAHRYQSMLLQQARPASAWRLTWVWTQDGIKANTTVRVPPDQMPAWQAAASKGPGRREYALAFHGQVYQLPGGMEYTYGRYDKGLGRDFENLDRLWKWWRVLVDQSRLERATPPATRSGERGPRL